MNDRIGAERLLHHWRELLPEDRLAHLIRDVARMQMRALQQRLSEHDVSFGHWTFLRILWATDGLTQRELSESAGVMEPTTFSAVKAMEAAGLIERRQLAGNRKNVHIFLTDKGRALEPLLVPLAEEVNMVSTKGMPPRTIATVRKALLGMIENLAAEDPSRPAPVN
ncbi:MarR family winged helix-turn-helix transcriptional regulator [Ottowia oryzae]|uniref:MarR family transcriptional regulator n=1 Tax=Ottowia oryzae TaxID=2109914 RepID=A0A2S0MFF6_9BURK|nr:MarR family transcriptional regulator [Ottowia oryzae]AVO34622.1 MarR family transcriptional regulator [Ottowia oryzae]